MLEFMARCLGRPHSAVFTVHRVWTQLPPSTAWVTHEKGLM